MDNNSDNEKYKDPYDIMCDFDNLHEAYWKACKGKRDHGFVCRYEANLLENLWNLSNRLYRREYKPVRPYFFYVYEPKKRLICANNFEDKIIQHSLCDNVLHPQLFPHLIIDNYASQPSKGTDFGLDRLAIHLKRHYNKHGMDGGILRGDVRKFFDTINRDILFEMVYRKVRSRDIVNLLYSYYDDSRFKPRGLAIGFQTSQVFAVFYLSPLDHFIKEVLKIKHYGRYMDDFFLIHEDKDYLRECEIRIREFLYGFGMELNEKTNIIPLKNGVRFLGFDSYITNTGRIIQRLASESKYRERRLLKFFRRALDDNVVTFEYVEESYQSWRAHVKRGDSFYLLANMDNLFYELFKEEIKRYGLTYIPDFVKKTYANIVINL